MEALDILKKDWQKENKFTEVSETELLKMIHKKSTSIVRKILIFSIIEIIFWTLLNVFTADFDSFKIIHESRFEDAVSFMNGLNFGIIIMFIYLFFRNYKNISTLSTTKKLMQSILKTKKTVNLYVIFNLVLIALGFCFGVYIAISTNTLLKDKILDLKFEVYLFTICFIALAVFILVFWYIYKLIYGNLVKQLLVNYNELMTTENQDITNE